MVRKIPCFWRPLKSTWMSSLMVRVESVATPMSEWNDVMTQASLPPATASRGPQRSAVRRISQSAAKAERARRAIRMVRSDLTYSGRAVTLTNLRHDIRNVAIIAHVDHGKTTLVDALLKQSHTFRDNQDVGTLIMDTNDLEREKGITILAKNTSVRHGDVTINIIDTPGHADFGGEVERVLNMADGCLLLVDAAEGPMPQTRFVLRKAFEVGLRIIIVINKVDRANADPAKTLERVHDLFLELAEDADQLEAPVIYSIAKEGRAGHSPEELGPDLEPLFKTIIERIPAPVIEPGGFQMLVANRAYDDYTGPMAIGRISRGSIAPGDWVAVLSADGEARRVKVVQALLYRGLDRIAVPTAGAGDIVVLT